MSMIARLLVIMIVRPTLTNLSSSRRRKMDTYKIMHIEVSNDRGGGERGCKVDVQFLNDRVEGKTGRGRGRGGRYGEVGVCAWCTPCATHAQEFVFGGRYCLQGLPHKQTSRCTSTPCPFHRREYRFLIIRVHRAIATIWNGRVHCYCF